MTASSRVLLAGLMQLPLLVLLILPGILTVTVVVPFA
ncbi:hypothetical protein HDG69_000190 [Isoptericola halotolerans]|uniref:ABC transporter permease n=1 Tax=Isoptericola halotolerans TaxID=300560 RepID=A0ABX1ZYF2_9MICO|nr:hypothetical protein [Isoptericola halotolerans]